MKKQFVIVGVITILVCAGLSGCLENNLYKNKPSDEEPQSETGFEWFQMGNTQAIPQLQTKQSKNLMDNRIGGYWHGLWQPCDYQKILDNEISGLGLKRVRLAINELDWNMIDWNKPELTIEPNHDKWITDIANNNVTITYCLSFWDKANHPEGVGLSYPRFKTEVQIERYLEYVQFIVHHFKDRVRYFEIWNEPNVRDSVRWIEVEDYINLTKRAIAVIRQEYPNAKIQVGGVTPLVERDSYDYFFSILRSEIMPLVDVVSWHVGAPSLDYEYWRDYCINYSSILQEIKDIASAHGFKGEYEADELNWRTPETYFSAEPWNYSEIVSAKYFARSIMMHLGMDVTVGLAGVSESRAVVFPTLRNLCNIMAGIKPISLTVKIQSEGTNIKNYSFSLPNNNTLIALWTDGIAVENNTGVNTTIIINGVEASKVIAIDPLKGYEQQLLSMKDNSN